MALLFNNEERLKSLIAKLRQKFKVIVYIATSEDDYIAADDGNIDWLNNFSNELFDRGRSRKSARRLWIFRILSLHRHQRHGTENV